jgi:hypothetical protein
MTNQYNLTSVPAGVVWLNADQLTAGHATGEWPENVTKWSGESNIPAIGEKVRITFNGLGTGVVTGYFAEHGWLGLYVVLDVQPAWRTKQGVPASQPAMVFGAEVKPA